MRRAFGIIAAAVIWLVVVIVLIVVGLYAWALIVQAVFFAALATAWALEVSRNRASTATALRNVRRSAELTRNYADRSVEKTQQESTAVRSEVDNLTREVRALQSLVKTSKKTQIDGDYLAALDDGLSRMGTRILKLERKLNQTAS